MWCGCPKPRFGQANSGTERLLAVLSSLFEYTGVYYRCYCKGDQLGLGGNGWLVLFKTDAELAQFATTPWAGGVAMSIIVCFITYFFFWLGSRKGYLSGV